MTLDDLLGQLRSEDGITRAEAVSELRKIVNSRKIDGLVAITRDPGLCELSHRDAVVLLEEDQDPSAANALRVLALAVDAPVDARVRAIGALARRDPGTLALGAEALIGDGAQEVRAALVMDSGRLSRENADQIVRRALDDPSTMVRSAVHFPVVDLVLKGLFSPTAAAFAKVAGRLLAEGLNTPLNRLREEEALLRVLCVVAEDPGAARAFEPIASRVVEVAEDPEAYDVDQGLFSAQYAAKVLAAVSACAGRMDIGVAVALLVVLALGGAIIGLESHGIFVFPFWAKVISGLGGVVLLILGIWGNSSSGFVRADYDPREWRREQETKGAPSDGSQPDSASSEKKR